MAVADEASPLAKQSRAAAECSMECRALIALTTMRSQVTDILVTHIHPDRTGGFSIGGHRVFENAVIHVSKKELAFWTRSKLKKLESNKNVLSECRANAGTLSGIGSGENV